MDSFLFEKVEKNPEVAFFFRELGTVGVGIHLHSEIEVLYVTAGDIFVLARQNRYHLRPGDILLINAFEPHEIHMGHGPGLHRVLQFSPEAIFGAAAPLGEKICVDGLITPERGEVYTEAKELLNRLFDAYHADTYRALAANAWLGAFLAFLLHNLQWRDRGSTTSKVEEEAELLRRIISYISNHSIEKVRLEDIAAQANFSTYYFSRFFKRMTGQTFVSYLNDLRLYRAESMLVNSNAKISEIAEEAGFASIKTFNRLFSKKQGMSPSDYRKQHQ